MATQTWANTQLATKQTLIPGLIYQSMFGMTNTNDASFQNYIELRGPSMGIRFNYNNVWTPHSINVDTYNFNTISYGTWRLYDGAGNPLYVGANSLDLTVGGSLYQNSDRRLKDNIKDADLNVIQDILNSVNVRTYSRNDYNTNKSRLCFTTQDIEDVLADDLCNIVSETTSKDDGDNGITTKTLDYARLVTNLWGVCKNLQAQIDILEQQQQPNANTPNI